MAELSAVDQPREVFEALRISQLDAAELDSELVSLTKLQLRNVFKYFRPDLLVRYGPELDAAVRCVLWHYSVHKMAATVGQKLLDLRYVDEVTGSKQWMSERQRILFGLLSIGGVWFGERLEDFSVATRHLRHVGDVWQIVRTLLACVKVASLVNFFIFLTRGQYVFLVERLLRIRAVFPKRQTARQVGFELMDRELLWHGFAEFLFFLLPLINFQKMRNFALRTVFPKLQNGEGVNEERSVNAYKECVVCGEWPVHPHCIVNCPHVFCYFCLQSNFVADASYACPVCAAKIASQDSIQPVRIPVTAITAS